MEIIISNKLIKIDREDWLLISSLPWTVTSYPVAQVNRKTIYMHRLIMNAPSGTEVDHINGDKRDNRRENLRLCTRSQNEANKPKPKNNTSGYKGVGFMKHTGKYRATIEINMKQQHLGSFVTAQEAAIAYNEAARSAFGEFARLNNV